jgi:signal transduction histidine kinase
VRGREALLSENSPLAPNYADDEVGMVAAAFDDALGQIQHTLDRERFFTSDVSHELRTPLTVVSTACELLQASTQLSEKQTKQLDRIQRAAQEMCDLVHTFLQLARNKLDEDIAVSKVTLADMAQEQYAQWSSTARDKHLALHLIEEPDAASNSSRFNTALLRAVMSNLIRNAVHYTDEGQVRLVLTTKGFRVEDSGKNIETCRQESIFQPFVRGASARGEGLGLGLSLVRRICEQQGWQVRLYNLVEGGNCFEVSLS